MAEESKKTIARKKPNFFRRDWHKMIKLGRTVKKNRIWKRASGRQNKIRMNRKGYGKRPKIGWSAAGETKGQIKGFEAVRIENVKQLESVEKGKAILIASVGKKKKSEIIKAAKEKKIIILNKYKKSEDKE